MIVTVKLQRLLTAFGAALICFAVGAQAQTVDKPARVVSALVRTGAIVEAVNKETRELKLIDASGNRFAVIADESVRNFDQIEPRDRIITEYLESIAVVIAPAGSEPLMGDGLAIAVAPEGEKPGIASAETHVVLATVTALNRSDRLVSLELEGGERRTVKVGDNARLDLVDIGNQVRLRITRAVAVEVVKPD